MMFCRLIQVPQKYHTSHAKKYTNPSEWCTNLVLQTIFTAPEGLKAQSGSILKKDTGLRTDRYLQIL